MLKAIYRAALTLCVAGLLGTAIAGSAQALPGAAVASATHADEGTGVTLARYRGGYYRHFRRYRRGGAFWPDYRMYYGIPAAPYSYNYGCGWLHRKALTTGSRYWWRRYRACIG